MLTLGVVPYLNALPLYKTLEARDDIKIVSAVPSLLHELLLTGECDAALLPVVDWFGYPDWQIVSDACIAADGAVLSVLLLSKKLPDAIRSIALDTSSHTSVALLKVLCAERYGITPRFVDHAPDLNAMLHECDAALLIGDPALRAYAQSSSLGLHIYDMGVEWEEHTGLPFVFAAWIARAGLDRERAKVLSRQLETARDVGVSQIPQLAQNAATHSLSADLIIHYLSNAIQHTLTPRRRAGLDSFRERCATHGLIKNQTTRR